MLRVASPTLRVYGLSVHYNVQVVTPPFGFAPGPRRPPAPHARRVSLISRTFGGCYSAIAVWGGWGWAEGGCGTRARAPNGGLSLLLQPKLRAERVDLRG